jgi:hypothetical protein
MELEAVCEKREVRSFIVITNLAHAGYLTGEWRPW